MRCLTSCAALLLACAFVPSRASAAVGEPSIGVPSVGNCTVPAAISLVGLSGGVVPAELGHFSVIVRSIGNTPFVNCRVVVEFLNTPELWIAEDQHDPALILNCPAKTVTKFTDINGRVDFVVLGGSNGADVASATSRARIFAAGVPIGQPIAASFDLDGQGGLGANDLSVFLVDFAAQNDPGGYRPRSDFDGSGSVGANDFSVLLTVFGSGSMTESAKGVCP